MILLQKLNHVSYRINIECSSILVKQTLAIAVSIRVRLKDTDIVTAGREGITNGYFNLKFAFHLTNKIIFKFINEDVNAVDDRNDIVVRNSYLANAYDSVYANALDLQFACLAF